MNRYLSIRWKLISTYLCLILIILFIINAFLFTKFRDTKIKDYIDDLKIQSNILSNQLNSDFKFSRFQNSISYSSQKTIKKYSFNLNTRIIYLNRSKEVVYDSNEEEAIRNIKNIKLLDKAVNGEFVAKPFVYNEDQQILYLASPVINNEEVTGVLFFVSSIDNLYAEVYELMNMILFISIIAVIITLIISFVFSDIISNPIRELSVAVKKLTYKGKTNKIRVRQNDEIGKLSESFNLLTTQLEQIEGRRKKFVSNVSHELRTPITSMKILAQTILEQKSWDEEVYRDFMNDIDTELNRLSDIITNLLYLVEVEKEEVSFNYEIQSINYLLNSIIKSLRPIAEQKSIQLSLIENASVQCYVDKNKLYQALLNIINNAIKYTESGGVRVLLDANDDKFIVEVIDTGIGIPEEEIPFIFDRFYRVDKARNSKKGSTGLGLSIAQEIIALHQGEIKVESQMDIGTKMKIILPLKES